MREPASRNTISISSGLTSALVANTVDSLGDHGDIARSFSEEQGANLSKVEHRIAPI
jgi:hypothetical protein